MEFYFLQAKAIENLHPGRANASTDSIDKVVQRDVGGIPCVESTSFKGALKMHFEQKPSNQKFIDAAFGAEGFNGAALSVGQYGPKQLDLLAIPIPIHPVPLGMNSTVLVTSWEILDRLYEEIDIYKPEATVMNDFHKFYIRFRNEHYASEIPLVFAPTDSNINIKSATTLGKFVTQLTEGPSKVLPEWLSKVVFDKSDPVKTLVITQPFHFEKLTNDDSLPVKHRNKIDWGESNNLWVEQFLPRGTRFITNLRVPDVLYYKDNTKIANHFKIFETEVNGKCIQAGANKSVGYGSCYFNIVK